MSKKMTKAPRRTLLPLGLCLLLCTEATASPPNTAPQAQVSPGPMDAVSRLCYGGEGSEAIEACQQLAAQINPQPGQYDEKAFVNSRLRNLLYEQGRYQEAVEAARRALEAVEKWKGSNSEEAWGAVTKLGNSLVDAGEFEEAEKQQRRAVMHQQETKPQDPELLATSQNNLAAVLCQRGKLKEAEQLLRRALETTEAALGKVHPDVATSQNNLATVLWQRGKLEEAEQLIRRALATREAALGKVHPAVATSQNILAQVLLRRGKSEEAEQLLRRALETTEAALGKVHPDVARSQNNLAEVLRQRGKLEEAEQLLRCALETMEAALGKDHPDVATSQNNLALVLRQRGKLEEAEQLMRRALATTEAALGQNHPDVAQRQNGLAWFELQKGRLDLALDWLSKSAVIREQAIQNSPNEAYAQGLLCSFQGEQMAIYGLALQSQQSEATKLAMQVALMNKSRTQQVGTLVKRALQSRLKTDSQRQRYEEMTRKLSERAKLLDGVGGQEKKEREKKLLWEALQIEQELSQELGVRSRQSMPGLKEIIGAVKGKLPNESALVEVVIGTTRDYKRWKDWEATTEYHYIALTLYPDGTMQAVDLGKVADVHAVVGPMYQALASPQENARAAGQAVYQKVFAKLESGLQEHHVKRLIVSGDGLLNLIPWGAVYDQQGYWADRYAIQYVSAGRDLLRPAAEVKSEAAVVLADPAAPEQRRLESAKWVSIELSQQLGVKPLLGENATEENLRKAHNPATMLLAAHGRFRPIPVAKEVVAMVEVAPRFGLRTLGQLRPFSRVPMEPEPIDMDNTEEGMHRSALALTPGKRPTDAKDDGYLTAEEVQQLELSGTQLVTMLACQGAVGAVGVGQGVYGLRRAFEQAGAETVVSTLWSVDEPSAAKLIQSYYNKLLKEKKGRVEAMEEAMRELRNDKEHPEYKHPYYWAPFVVTGLDGPLRIPAQAAGK